LRSVFAASFAFAAFSIRSIQAETGTLQIGEFLHESQISIKPFQDVMLPNHNAIPNANIISNS
jgi:hypothetical protein